jgi:hypothetical protein
MGESEGGKNRRKRKSRGPVGEHLVMGELLRRGFDAQLSNHEEHVVLVRAGDSPPKAVQLRTVYSTPWYVRCASFSKRADQVAVYVLLRAERMGPARFFVAKNGDLVSQVRQPPTWRAFGLIDAMSIEQYEDDWDILR